MKRLDNVRKDHEKRLAELRKTQVKGLSQRLRFVSNIISGVVRTVMLTKQS